MLFLLSITIVYAKHHGQKLKRTCVLVENTLYVKKTSWLDAEQLPEFYGVIPRFFKNNAGRKSIALFPLVLFKLLHIRKVQCEKIGVLLGTAELILMLTNPFKVTSKSTQYKRTNGVAKLRYAKKITKTFNLSCYKSLKHKISAERNNILFLSRTTNGAPDELASLNTKTSNWNSQTQAEIYKTEYNLHSNHDYRRFFL